MKPRRLFPRLIALACAALLLSNSAPAGLAQRRRRATPPRAQAQAPPHPVATHAPGATPKPDGAQTMATPATSPPGRAQQPTRRAAEPDLSAEEMLAADSYTVYLEVRRIGTLSRAEEVKAAVASLRLLGGEEAKPVIDLYTFVSDNAEALGESRVVAAFMPARPGLPQAFLAVELESSEAAVGFEPKLRRVLGEQVRQVKKAIAPGGDAAPAAAAKPEPREAATSQRGTPKPPAADFALKRVGRWLLAADAAFTLKQLRGDENEPRLADTPRFQSIRGRFTTEALFVYVDTDVAQRGWALQMQRVEAAQQPDSSQPTLTASTRPGVGEMAAAAASEQERQPAEDPQPDPMGEDVTGPASGMSPEESAASAETHIETENLTAPPEPPKPSEEELAVRGMGRVLNNLWGGVPRIPGAAAFGIGLEHGAVSVRLAVENTPDGTIVIIPFLPNIVSGPPVTADAASVAPADAGLFFAGSLDWMHVYNSTLGAASVSPEGLMSMTRMDDEGESERKAERQPTADETIAAVEKVFGFKFKEDLLPALGNEVAFSMPLDASDLGIGRFNSSEKKEERDAEPGFLYISSLNNPEKIREILPGVLAAFGFVPVGGPSGQTEKRAGHEIHAFGQLSYTIINSFLVAGELKAVRHCVDAFEARQTLAASNAYRDTTAWQAKQKLVHLYVSDSILKSAVEETRKHSGGSTDPAVRALLMQLETAETAPASYEATNEGDVVMHEMRLPLSLIRTYALAIAVSAKDAPVLMNETMTIYALQRIAGAEAAYKDAKKKARYGTLEELLAEELLEKTFFENMEYKVELSAAGDKFEVTATPKTYGKTGRRSFFLDQTGTVHAADRKGQPANASDPSVEQ